MEEFDPRKIDGDPHEVAEEAGKFAEARLRDALEALEGFHWAARGAWLTAEEHRLGDMPKGEDFETTAQGRALASIHAELSKALNGLRVATAAAAWNPRSHL